MRITESQLRRIVREEAKKFKKGKRINESFPGANEELFNAMESFVQGWMDESGVEDPAGACRALLSEVEAFCQAFEENY
jgi:hypothetical protein